MNGVHACRVCRSDNNLVIISKKKNEGLLAKVQSVIGSSLTNEHQLLFICIECSQNLSLVYDFKLQYESTCNKFRKLKKHSTKNSLIESALEENVREKSTDLEKRLNQEKQSKSCESIENVWFSSNYSKIIAKTDTSTWAENKALKKVDFRDYSLTNWKDATSNAESVNRLKYNDEKTTVEIATVFNYKSKDSCDTNESTDLPVFRSKFSSNAVIDYHADNKTFCKVPKSKVIAIGFLEKEDSLSRNSNEFRETLRRPCKTTDAQRLQEGVSIEEIVEMQTLKENLRLCMQAEKELQDDTPSICSRDENDIALDAERCKCEKCGKVFHPSNIKEHQMFHLLPDMFKCELCGKAYTRMDSLRKHLILHSNPETFKCDECTRTFTNPYQLKEHQMLHKNPNCFKCEICGKSFTRRRILIEHQVRHSNPELFDCEKCGRPFTTLGALKYHEETHLKEGVDASKTLKVTSTDTQTVQRERNYITCHDCNKRMHRRNFKQHEMIHRNPDSFKCSECGKSFSRKDSLKKHQLLHSNPDIFTCDECGKVYTDPYHLKQHRKLHLNPDSFKCDICGKAFSKPGALTQHKLQHSNPDLFKCKKCGKTFRNIGSLKYHEQLHSKRGLQCVC